MQTIMGRLNRCCVSLAAMTCLTGGILAGCSHDDTTSPSGNAGAGATESSGGAGIPGTGGAVSTGGGPSSGGATGSGGDTSSGGMPNTGGVSATGGVALTGGGPPTGGSATGGAPTGGTGATSAGGHAAGAGYSNAAGAAGAAGSATHGGASGASGAPGQCPSSAPPTGGTQYCSNIRGDAGSGYTFELWASGTGSGCMTVSGVDATFSATWDGVEDFLGRVGLGFDQTRTHEQIGTISADFAETKTGDGGFLYVGVYGWTVNPLREYYILDDWGSTKPAGTSSDGTPRNHAGTIQVDGAVYDVWTKLRENKPAITGDSETFEQYFSVRDTPRRCGHISISEHFSQWEGLGLPLGGLHEAMLLVEAQDNSGRIDFSTARVVVE